MPRTREEIIAAIRAKRAAKKNEAPKPRKYARLRIVSKYKAAEVSEALTELVEDFSGLAEDLTAFQENLDLIPEVAEDASPEEKTAALKSKKFAAAFRRLAEEEPGEFADHLQQIYNRLDDLVGGVEFLAENTGVKLEEPPAEVAAEEEENEAKIVAEEEASE